MVPFYIVVSALRSILVSDGVQFVGRWKDPETNRIGQGPSDLPCILSRRQTTLSTQGRLSRLPCRLLSFLKAVRRGAYSLSNIPIDPGDSSGTSRRVLTDAVVFPRISALI